MHATVQYSTVRRESSTVESRYYQAGVWGTVLIQIPTRLVGILITHHDSMMHAVGCAFRNRNHPSVSQCMTPMHGPVHRGIVLEHCEHTDEALSSQVNCIISRPAGKCNSPVTRTRLR
jgi:hypothetical protein